MFCAGCDGGAQSPSLFFIQRSATGQYRPRAAGYYYLGIWGQCVATAALFFCPPHFIFSSMNPPHVPLPFSAAVSFQFWYRKQQRLAYIYSRCLVKTLNYNRSSLQRVSSFIVVGNRKRIWKEMKLKKKEKESSIYLSICRHCFYIRRGNCATSKLYRHILRQTTVDLQWL